MSLGELIKIICDFVFEFLSDNLWVHMSSNLAILIHVSCHNELVYLVELNFSSQFEKFVGALLDQVPFQSKDIHSIDHLKINGVDIKIFKVYFIHIEES